MYSEKEIKEALSSISEIKQVLQGNMQTIRPVFNCPGYISMCYVMGASMIFLFGAMIATEHVWGTLSSGPLWVKVALVVLWGFVLLGTGWWKMKVIKRYSDDKLGGMSVEAILRLPEFTKLVRDTYMIIGAGAVVCCIYAYRIDNWWTVVPFSFFILAFVCIYMSGTLLLEDYRYIGYLSFVLSIVTGLFMHSHYLYWLGGALAVLFFGMGLILTVVARHHAVLEPHND